MKLLTRLPAQWAWVGRVRGCESARAPRVGHACGGHGGHRHRLGQLQTGPAVDVYVVRVEVVVDVAAFARPPASRKQRRMQSTGWVLTISPVRGEGPRDNMRAKMSPADP